jgi:hypothetical protein
MKKDKITFDDIFEKGLEEKIDNINKKLEKTIELKNEAISVTNKMLNVLGIKPFPTGGIIINKKEDYKFSDTVKEILFSIKDNKEKEIRTTEGLTTTFKDGVITISGKLNEGDIIQVDYDKMETRKVGKEDKSITDITINSINKKVEVYTNYPPQLRDDIFKLIDEETEKLLNKIEKL